MPKRSMPRYRVLMGLPGHRHAVVGAEDLAHGEGRRVRHQVGAGQPSVSAVFEAMVTILARSGLLPMIQATAAITSSRSHDSAD